ncbi:membrane protein insertase YidC [Seongchinamella unica]|uniref:Membrane protein insertase YidC n=1 Tax=Seongchinamella unica TaxID=2547392 RepID=A0A4R5LWB2_9GAMM|nr:membrane protein insertase YidC [Seongchinamella unica]TDG15764.1 membrane protein insertase YidC [Seongchinamella unica]
MDLQRSLLIGAIAVLSFMLLTEWVAFKDERTQAADAQTTRLIANGDSQPAELPGVVDEPVSVNDEDVPTAPQSAASTDTPDTPSTATNTGRIVLVRTDSLQLAIDLQGGDIIELALPRHLEKIDNPDIPFVLLEQNEQRTYIAQSGLIGTNGIDSNGRATFTASADSYEMAAGQDKLVVNLHWQGEGDVNVTKRFTFTRGDYLVQVDYLVENNSDSRWHANLFGQIKRDSSPAPSDSNSGMGMQPFLGAAITQPDERFTKFSFEDMREEPFKAQLPGGWIAMLQHYFLSAWIPNAEQSHTYSTRVTSAGFNIAGFTSPALTLDPGQSGQTGAQFYAGPKDQYRLAEISPYLDLVVDYGWLWWIAQPLFWLLNKIFALVGNWGVAIILLTVLVKAAFFKLSATSYRSMARMRKVQPKMMDIREQYADDKQKQSQAMMELYRKEKVNPMGGCLPILVQMPVFIALYWVLMESVELRHAPFALWINDLSVMDPYFVLPVLMGASMWFMQKLNPPPTDPMQAKIMQWLPIVFTFFFLWFPAGLVLYWVVNNLLSMAQQYVITRQIENAES